jgi:hypothetical protein
MRATIDQCVEPEPPVDPDRIPVTEAHRKGVFDPMTGMVTAATDRRQTG